MSNEATTRSRQSDKDKMSLPVGRTCGQCVHFSRCEWLISCNPLNETCDWAPSKFKEKADGI